MDKSRLIWGIVCLVLAGLLAGLSVALPADKMVLMVGDRNMPWVPVVLLGVVGVVLLVSAGTPQPEEAETAERGTFDQQRASLNKRLETIAWGCFLIMLGGFAFVPEQIIAGGFWSIGVGIIMLGLNAARYGYGLRMSTFTTVLGVISVISGVLEVVGLNTLGGPILLIVLGLYLIVKPWFASQQLFGRAERA